MERSLPPTPAAGGPAAGNDWQSVLAAAVSDPAELCRLLGLPAELAADAAEAAGSFPLRIPRTYLARIRRGDPRDPLLAQVLPTREERTEVPHFVPDPLGEAAAARPSGLLRKYKCRLLILASGDCGVHCRFCFRRHYKEPPPCNGGALAEIAADESIEEVILSGGDPLTLPDDRLADLAGQLAAIPHLRRLRLHTRMPIVIPQRVTDSLLGWLRATRLTPLVVVHANHPAELDAAVAAALARLVDAGIPLLNQAVLLRGINDHADVLAELCRRLVDLRVMPYYLHQLDRVAGAAHFEVPEDRGIRLIAALRARLPGYAVPRYVRDRPGGASKEVLA
jgi:EF-P beta-lysylation protein EpmB